jgi:hypothetical protein
MNENKPNNNYEITQDNIKQVRASAESKNRSSEAAPKTEEEAFYLSVNQQK